MRDLPSEEAVVLIYAGCAVSTLRMRNAATHKVGPQECDVASGAQRIQGVDDQSSPLLLWYSARITGLVRKLVVYRVVRV